jgi:hypothetical protein
MQAKTKTDRIITVILRKRYFENYLRFIFDTPEGPIMINRDHELGKYLFSRVRYSHLKNKTDITGCPVELILPANGNDCSRTNFIYYSVDDMARINDFIESSAYLDLRMMIDIGNKDLKMDRKTIISIFSDAIYGEDKYEMLKKDEYRKRKKVVFWLKKSAKQLGYNIL